MTDPVDIGNRYGFHPPSSPEKNAAHNEIRARFVEFAKFLSEILPEGKYSEKVQDTLELASMWANKAVASQSVVDLDSIAHPETQRRLGLQTRDVVLRHGEAILSGTRKQVCAWIMASFVNIERDGGEYRVRAMHTENAVTLQEYLGITSKESDKPLMT